MKLHLTIHNHSFYRSKFRRYREKGFWGFCFVLFSHSGGLLCWDSAESAQSRRSYITVRCQNAAACPSYRLSSVVILKPGLLFCCDFKFEWVFKSLLLISPVKTEHYTSCPPSLCPRLHCLWCSKSSLLACASRGKISNNVMLIPKIWLFPQHLLSASACTWEEGLRLITEFESKLQFLLSCDAFHWGQGLIKHFCQYEYLYLVQKQNILEWFAGSLF